jgi:hypothetical protein
MSSANAVSNYYPWTIEPGIRPVCDALNAIPNVTTCWSCQGHPERPSPPFVIFKAPLERAYEIHCMLGSGHGPDQSLRICWLVTANFYGDNGSLQFMISPNDQRFPGSKWRFFRRWNRALVDADIERMAYMLQSYLKADWSH